MKRLNVALFLGLYLAGGVLAAFAPLRALGRGQNGASRPVRRHLPRL